MIVQINRYAWSNSSHKSQSFIVNKSSVGLDCVFFINTMRLLLLLLVFCRRRRRRHRCCCCCRFIHSILTLLFINEEKKDCDSLIFFSFSFRFALCAHLFCKISHIIRIATPHHTECIDFHVHKLKCNTKRHNTCINIYFKKQKRKI